MTIKSVLIPDVMKDVDICTTAVKSNGRVCEEAIKSNC